MLQVNYTFFQKAIFGEFPQKLSSFSDDNAFSVLCKYILCYLNENTYDTQYCETTKL
jgi:hypothetical protein